MAIRFRFAFSLMFLLALVSFEPAFGQNGTPHPDDGYWDNRFGHPLLSGYIGSPGAAAANGKFYYSNGGMMNYKDGYRWYGMWVWDGTGWTTIAPSLTGTVFEVILPGNGDAFTGAGNFTNLNEQGINYIATWNGSSWDSLGPQLNGRVRAMYNGVQGLYVGGEFNKFGDSTANRIAVWGGSSWGKLIDVNTGEGVNGTVYAIAGTQSHLYLGGSFTNAGGVTAVNRVVEWNWTTKQWTKVALDGLNSDVFALTNSLGTLWAGGWFDHAGIRPVEYVATITDTGWVSRKANLTAYPTWRTMYSPPSGGVYVQGTISSPPSPNGWPYAVVYHNGTDWQPLGNVTAEGTPFMTGDGDTLYASVGESMDSTRVYRGMAKWNGSSWKGMGQPIGGYGADDEVKILGYANGIVYAGGVFRAAGDLRRYDGLNFAMFEGGEWKMAGGPILFNSSVGTISGMTTIGTDLYVGGIFNSAGGTPAKFIAKWNGSTWSALGSGMNNSVRAVGTDGTNLYAVGIFDSVDGQWMRGIAKWNGSSWEALGKGLGLGLGFSENPKAIAVNGNEVYVAGRLSSVDSGLVVVEDFAKWNGVSWSAIPAPPNPITGSRQPVEALAIIGNDLYAAVNYYNGNYLGFVLKWNGSEWSQVGGMFDRTVYGLYANGTDLYVAGDFEVVGTDTIWGIAKWNGSQWSTLGTGVTQGLYGSYAKAVLGTPDGLYVGGSFRQAGKYSSGNIGLWKNYTHVGPTLGLTAPVQTSPADGATGQPTSLTATWIATPNATRYRFQLSTDSTFATTVISDTNVATTSKNVSGLLGDTKYFWRIQAKNSTQSSLWSSVWDFRTSGGATSVEEVSAFPSDFALEQNYPNPFNPSTLIRFALPERADVELAVYSLLGERVAVLVDEEMNPGYYEKSFDARALPSGVYFYRLTAGNYVRTMKLVVMK